MRLGQQHSAVSLQAAVTWKTECVCFISTAVKAISQVHLFRFPMQLSECLQSFSGVWEAVSCLSLTKVDMLMQRKVRFCLIQCKPPQTTGVCNSLCSLGTSHSNEQKHTQGPFVFRKAELGNWKEVIAGSQKRAQQNTWLLPHRISLLE